MILWPTTRLVALAAATSVIAFAQGLPDSTNYFVFHNQFSTPNRVIAPGAISGVTAPVGYVNKTGAASQQWLAIPAADGSYRIVTRELGRGWSLEANELFVPAAMKPTTGSPGQRWRMKLTPEPCVEFYNDALGTSAELDSANPPTHIQLAPYDPSVQGQCWTAEKISAIPQPVLSTTYVRLKGSNGLYLHMQANDGSVNGALQMGAIQSSWQSAMWSLERVTGIAEVAYQVKNRLTGKYLLGTNNGLTGTFAAGAQPPAGTGGWALAPPTNTTSFRLESRAANQIAAYSGGVPLLVIGSGSGLDLQFTVEAVPSPPSIASVATNPNPGVEFQPTVVTVNGASFDPATVTVSIIKMPGGCTSSCTIPNSAMTVKTATQLQFTVNQPVGDYFVTVINGDGQQSQSPGYPYTIQSAIPTLTGFTTSPSPVLPGVPFTMTITGTGFSTPRATIGPNFLVASDLASISATSITTKPITLPAPGSYGITVRNENGTSSNSLSITVQGGPMISSISGSPNPPLAEQSFTMIIAGSGFDPASIQLLHNTTVYPNSAFFNKSATSVSVNFVMPAGTHTFRVRNGSNGVESNPSTITVQDVAVLDSVTTSPASPVQGQAFTVTLNGRAFQPGTAEILFGGTVIPNSSLTVKTTTQLSAVVNTTAGTYAVKARNGAAAPGASVSKNVTVSGPPVVTPIDLAFDIPQSGSDGPEAFTLTINGSGFDPAVAQVYLSGAPIPTSALTVKTTTQLAFTVTLSLTSYQVTVKNGGSPNSNALTLTLNSPPPPVSQGAHFVPISPCRAADTRSTSAIPGKTFRDFTFGACNIPANATAIALNVTLVPNGQFGFLSIWPAGQAQPVVSTMNSLDGRIKANAAIVGLGTNNGVSIYVTDTAHIILDVNGYFVPAGTPGALAFYPVSPCRVVDTRLVGGGGIIAAKSTRRITGDGSCLPAQAQAYSLNVTVVPPGPLGYLTLWPDGSAQPVASTLNDLTGTVVANAAILRAGTGGAINAFVTDDSHMIVDLNGYFAPPGQPGALAFYPLQPCRIFDTRNPNGAFGGPAMVEGVTREFTVPSSGCNVPATALAYVTNATVVPSGVFGFLTLWQGGVDRPTVSTLNAVDGALTSNAAIVPASAGGVIRVFASSPGNLLLDVSGYFAP